MKKTWQDLGKEWLDTLVVAISVAMAFRAYFFEPFKIPTGSMQKTLWGYHTTEGVEKGTWDTAPLSWLKWLWSGEKVVEYKAPVDGTVIVRDGDDGFADVLLLGSNEAPFRLPTDAAHTLNRKFFRKGETIWKGTVTTGDFIFVNRWKWNFFQPQNGQVMIFSTTGVGESPVGRHQGADGKRYHLAQGTHYIKRMKARPGETYVLEHPPTDTTGKVIDALPNTVTMGPDEYFACGDNFMNSNDSRYWGPVPRQNLRGEGSFVFWPFTGWRIIR